MRGRAGQRAAVTEQADDRRPLQRPVTGLCAAAGEPGVLAKELRDRADDLGVTSLTAGVTGEPRPDQSVVRDRYAAEPVTRSGIEGLRSLAGRPGWELLRIP